MRSRTGKWNVCLCSNNKCISSSQESKTLLPTKYLEFKDIFNKSKTTLSDHRPYDCVISLQPSKEPPWGLIYKLSPFEPEALWEYIDKHMADGFIRLSKSPTSAPTFLGTEKDGSLSLDVVMTLWLHDVKYIYIKTFPIWRLWWGACRIFRFVNRSSKA